MVKGPGLYSDIGKKARGPSFSFFVPVILLINFIFHLYSVISSSRSSLQGLPDRPQVHRHHLHFCRSCKLLVPFALIIPTFISFLVFNLFRFCLWKTILHQILLFCVVSVKSVED